MILLLIAIVSVVVLVLLMTRGRISAPPEWRRRTIHYKKPGRRSEQAVE